MNYIHCISPQNLTTMQTFPKITFSLLVAALLSVGCQKEINQPESITAVSQSSDSRHHENIRLVQNASEYGVDQYEYNKQGLVEKWNLIDFATYIHEYDKWGRLKKAKAYNEVGTFTNTIFFYYNKKGQRFHEKWYDTNWKLSDEVFYEFDNKGRGVKIESKIQSYKVFLTWSKEDNMRTWALYVDGVISARGEYSYNHNLKNPFSAIPGLGAAYPFSNGFFYENKLYATTEDAYVYDENGKLIDYTKQDPSKTIARPGPQGYVASEDVFDIGSQSYIHFVFSYEKGRGSYHYEKCRNKKVNAWQKFMKRDGKLPMKDKLRELRREFKKG